MEQIDNENQELTEEEEDCTPLTDEEFREFQKKEQRTEKRIKAFFSAIWDTINFFT